DPGWRSRAHGPSARTSMAASEPGPDPGNHRHSSRIRAIFDGSQLERSNHESVWARIQRIFHDGWQVSSSLRAPAAYRVLFCRARLCSRKMILDRAAAKLSRASRSISGDEFLNSTRPVDPACEEEGPNMDGVGRLWRCGLSVFEPPGVPGSDRLGWKNGLDGERMTAADHPGEMANDHRRIETSDRGGFGDGEAAVNQARGPLLGRHVLRCSVGAGLREGRDHHSPGSRWRDGIARLLPSPDGIRLGGSLALPARRSGNRMRERGDCMK